MKPEYAIEAINLTKKFKVYLDKGHTLKEKALFRKRRKYQSRVVLDGISFAVEKGEAVGLIGHNGCGKSTTLKLLTRIMYPDSGTIRMDGRVSSLIELGAGFHPDMSGRENICINASIFGLNKKEIESRMEDIISFSELEEFIDNPVRTYSSGMYMRLAFAVAINVQADILLIDEILAVGDANFQAKCFERLKELKAGGTTIVIVSHSLGQIEQICDRSIWVDGGRIRDIGTPADVHPRYLAYMGGKRKERAAKEQINQMNQMKQMKQLEQKERNKQKGQEADNAHADSTACGNKTGAQEASGELGGLEVKIVKSELLDENGEVSSMFQAGSKMTIRVAYERTDAAIKESEFGFHIFRSDGLDCYGTNTLIDKVQKVTLKDRGVISVEFAQLLLLQGRYRVDLAFHDETGLTYHHVYSAASFEIMNYFSETGLIRLEHRWVADGLECGRR